MKIDRKMLDSFLHLPDDKLGRTLRLLAGANASYAWGEENPQTLRKLRAVLQVLTDADLERINALREIYKETR